MAITLYTRLEPGDWLVILTRQQRAFSTDNIPDAIMRGNLIGGVLENLMIARKLRKVQERIQYEVDQIAEMERSLLFGRREMTKQSLRRLINQLKEDIARYSARFSSQRGASPQ